MSLEAHIEELNTNIKALIVALGSAAPVAVAKAETKKPTAATVSSASGATPPATETKADAPADEALDYEKHVKPAALAVAAKKGRDALIGIIGAFKFTPLDPDGNPLPEKPCATVKDVKPGDYAAVVEAMNKAIVAKPTETAAA